MNKYFTVKKGLDSVEAIGVVILLLVVTAIIGLSFDWGRYPAPLYVGFNVLFFSIIVSIVSSLGRLLRIWRNDQFLAVWGIFLLIIGGGALVFLPEFFHTMKELPYSYWHRVSLYSLPAICIEGGLFSLFRAYLVYASHKRTSREHWLLFIVFILYATTAVGVNFLAINNTISIAHQLLFSRIILGVTVVVTMIVYRLRTTVSQDLFVKES